MTWQWFVSQGFAFVALIFIIVANQQKSTLKYVWIYNFGTISIFASVCFLGNVSAIILNAMGIIRGFIAIYFAYKPNTKPLVKTVTGVSIVVLLIILNIIFWTNYLGIFSIVIGTLLVVTFLQNSPRLIRRWMVLTELLLITYYIILMSPISVALELFGLISAIVGIIRLDLKKKNVSKESEEKSWYM